MTALAGRYVTDTAHFLPVTTEKALIQAADDPQGPETPAESFAELEAEADPAVRDQVLEVLNESVRDAESVIEAFGAALYSIPYAPVDPIVRSLAVRWAWISLRERHGNLSQSEADAARGEIRSFGDRISDERVRLVSVKLGDPTLAGQSEVHSWGSEPLSLSRSNFELGGSWTRNPARKPWEG